MCLDSALDLGHPVILSLDWHSEIKCILLFRVVTLEMDNLLK